MDLLQKIRKFESMHIIFWLVKDSCWMLELKWLGAFMVVPTLFLAVFIIFKTVNTKDLYINLAVFFWITANSFWMIMEFFNHSLYKDFAMIPFAIGFIFIAIFYIQNESEKEIIS